MSEQADDALLAIGQVEKAFGMSMDTLLRMQAWWDAHSMRERSESITVQRYTPEPR